MTVIGLLRWRASELPGKPTAEALAKSLSVERFGYPKDAATYEAVVRFRRLRQDARVAKARAALGPA